MTKDSRLHTLSLEHGSIEIMTRTPHFIDERKSVFVFVRDADESASQSLTPSQARALASILTMAADEAELLFTRKAVA